ncbi:MAG: hypothetical protein Q4Q04_05030, partial [Methanocorpusculum sp.]|nr:hypothetical protein [Methanocorpusculum sp.]
DAAEKDWGQTALKNIQPTAAGAGNVTQVVTMQAGTQPVSGTGVGKLMITAEVTELAKPTNGDTITILSADGSLVKTWEANNLTIQKVTLTVSAK